MFMFKFLSTWADIYFQNLEFNDIRSSAVTIPIPAEREGKEDGTTSV